MVVTRNIGLIGDGATDRIIFAKIVECILTEGTGKDFLSCNIIDLQRQDIHEAVQEYLKNEKKNPNSERNISIQNRENIVKRVARILYGGFEDFIGFAGNICNCDVLIFTTDSEIKLGKPEDYLGHRNIELFDILSEATLKFYEIIFKMGYSRKNTPLVLPVVTFPSTEILIAAIKESDRTKYYNKTPGELKQMLYGKTGTLSYEELSEKALKAIDSDGIEKIFNNIPESRNFIQTLSFAKISCFL